MVDLSKASGSIVHDLYWQKLSAYGYDYNSLKLINSFQSCRKLGTKIGYCYIPYLDLLMSIPQGSILGPLLFNIYMRDLFLCNFESNIINHVDTVPYASEPSMDFVLSETWKRLFCSFYMVSEQLFGNEYQRIISFNNIWQCPIY